MMIQLIAEVVGILPVFILVGMVYLRVKRMDTDERRDPITTELRHLPAYSLQERRDKTLEWLIDQIVIVLTVGLIIAIMITSRRIGSDVRPWDWLDFTAIAFAFGGAIYYGIKINAKLPEQRKIKQAIRAELATAQELAGALAGNNRIIHDVQAKDFNIDHVVITPAGIFAVETKSRRKPPAGQGATAVRVRYDGRQLEFPTWTETGPIEQAARQARWLADYLQQSTGEHFPVFAIVALPGWYIEFTARITDDMVRVINPKNCQWLLLPEKQPARLDAAAIQRACFQIEKLAKLETE